MAFDVQAVETGVKEVQAIGDEILEVLETVEPGVALPAALAEKILNLAGTMITKAIDAYNGAADTPIDAQTIAALGADPTPLDAPTS